MFYLAALSIQNDLSTVFKRSINISTCFLVKVRLGLSLSVLLPLPPVRTPK